MKPTFAKSTNIEGNIWLATSAVACELIISNLQAFFSLLITKLLKSVSLYNASKSHSVVNCWLCRLLISSVPKHWISTKFLLIDNLKFCIHWAVAQFNPASLVAKNT